MLRGAKPLDIDTEEEKDNRFEVRPSNDGGGRKPYQGKNFNPKFKKADRKPRPPPKDAGALPKFKTNGPPKPLQPSNEPIVTRDDPIWADAIFAANVAVCENKQRKFINVNLASQAPITERTLDFIYKANQSLEKTLPREAFRYYSTALTWMRIIETKKNSSQALSTHEQYFRELYENRSFNIPEPILLFLRSSLHASSTSTCKYASAMSNFAKHLPPFNFANRSSGIGEGYWWSSKAAFKPVEKTPQIRTEPSVFFTTAIGVKMPVAINDFLRSYFTREAEERLRDSIPNKIRQIDELLKENIFDINVGLKRIRESTDNLTIQIDDSFKSNNNNIIKHDLITPLKLPILINDVLEKTYLSVRPFILNLIEDSQILRMWIQLNIPRIEDGNNFGVSVQEEVLIETNKAEFDGISMLDFYGDYLMYRAKVASKICKWPNLADYRRALADADEGAYLRLRMNLNDIKNHYTHLYDIYQKNGTKLRAPRNEIDGQINIMY